MTCWRLLAGLFALTLGLAPPAAAGEFRGSFANIHDRVWLGEHFWANPMEDWRVAGGRLECLSTGANRNVHVLTRQLGPGPGTFTVSVRLGRLDKGDGQGSAGFRVGIRDEIDDYRAALLRGDGLDAGITVEGRLFVTDTTLTQPLPPEFLAKSVELRLSARPEKKGAGSYSLTLFAHDPVSGKQLESLSVGKIPAGRLVGNLALVNNHSGKSPPKEGGARFWFNDWQIGGSKVESYDRRNFGPILWSMHTLSRGVLKMTAQMPPLGAKDSQTVRLQVGDSTTWKTIGEVKIAPLSFTATFRVPGWNDQKDVPCRLAYTQLGKDGSKREAYYTGVVRKDPVQQSTLVMAALSCQGDMAFPNREIVYNLTVQDPDLLFFAGDQIYESSGGFPLVRTPVERACLNYLRKWYLFGMSFGELMRDRPTVCIPDDHDVYQGNIWGNGGNPVAMAEHERGGYVQHRDFVECVHRTQTAHLPDPFDPTPIQQKISVYYCDLVYGRVGFAILADRMFKSGPKGNVPAWPGRPDHVKDPKIDVRTLDRLDLHLLGERQEKFLQQWAADWKGVDMKCVLSQTIFCNLANYHGAKEEYLIADLDSGGWPQSGRNRALDLMRRGFALHVAGDQHLASLVHHGINAPADANWSFCVPAIANIYPRRWQPDKEGIPVKGRPAPGLPNTGDYLDGLKNHIRVHAVGNPEDRYRKPRVQNMHDKGCGFGIVRFNRKDRTYTLECYRLLVDTTKPAKTNQFPGWPRTISMLDNFGRKPAAYLPTIEVTGMTDPVVQVIREKTKEIVYTLRIAGTRFRPMVFAPGRYTVVVGELGTDRLRMLPGVELAKRADEVIKVSFP